MKKSYIASTLQTIYASLRSLLLRFPLPVLIILFLSAVFFYTVNKNNTFSENITRIILSGIVWCFFAIGVSLFSETKIDKKYKYLSYAAWIIYMPLFYFYVKIGTNFSIEWFTYFMLHLIGFIGLMYSVPFISSFLHNRDVRIEYSNYFTRVSWMLLMSGIVWWALMLLWAIAIASLDSLFDLSVLVGDIHAYENWAIISFVITAPLYGLLHFPESTGLQKSEYEVNKFFSFLIRYVATPFIIVYFTILYLYTLKVLIDFTNWPKWIISWMVIGFSVFGYIVYMFSKSYEENTWFISLFRRYFPCAVLPQLFMLGYAIYLRISQYGLTVNRYFVVIFWFWLLGVSIYFCISKKKSLITLPVSLACISFIISIWPWSVVNYPYALQYKRLTNNLIKAKILQNGKIVPLSEFNAIEKDLSSEISAEIRYLCEYNGCKDVKNLFSEQLAWVKESYPARWSDDGELSNWTIIDTINQKVKLWYVQESDSSVYELNYQSRENEDYVIFPMDIAWYDSILRVYGSGSYSSDAKEYISIDIHSWVASIVNSDKKVLDTFSLDSINTTLRGKAKNLLWKDMTFDLTGKRYHLKLILSSYSIPVKPSNSSNNFMNNIAGYGLIKEIK